MLVPVWFFPSSVGRVFWLLPFLGGIAASVGCFLSWFESTSLSTFDAIVPIAKVYSTTAGVPDVSALSFPSSWVLASAFCVFEGVLRLAGGVG